MGCYYLLNGIDLITNLEICFIVMPLHIPVTEIVFTKYDLIKKHTHDL